MRTERDIKTVRAEMEMAKQQSEKTFGPDQKLPRRFGLYEKIKENVSLRTVDAVIIITAVLIIVFLIVGIVTGSPTT